MFATGLLGSVMCEMALIVLSALALLALILLARWEGRRKDERARRDGLVIDGLPVDELLYEPRSGDHDVVRGDERCVSVVELIERERQASFRQRAAALAGHKPESSTVGPVQPGPGE